MLCFLLLQPPILGAPLDSAKIHSLSSICPPPHQTNFGSLTNFSLLSFCSGCASLKLELVMLLRKFPTTFSLSKRFLSTKNTHDLASSIVEFNKELEDIFGEPLSSAGPLGSSGSGDVTQDTRFSTSEVSEKVCGLTHIGKQGEAQMVDVSPKQNTKRTAVASGKVVLGKEVFDLVSANQLAKGDVLSVAKIAGITGAKQTSNLIPLCHNISLSHVDVDLALNHRDYSVDIHGQATTMGKTGVEMEALTAVSIAGLTIYDMCKAASKNIEISNVRLELKTGGKSGDWSREE